MPLDGGGLTMGPALTGSGQAIGGFTAPWQTPGHWLLTSLVVKRRSGVYICWAGAAHNGHRRAAKLQAIWTMQP